MNSIFYRLVIVCLLCSMISSTPIIDSVVPAQEIGDVQVLAVIGDDFGMPFFDMTELWESWGCSVTVASIDDEPISCHNRPPIAIEPDLMVADLNNITIRNYDILFIPSGAHWDVLGSNDDVKNLLNFAKQNGLVITTICWSLKTLAMVTGIINGVKVVELAGIGNDGIPAAGAITMDGPTVVSDQNIVSGDNGIGAGGYMSAPMNDTCEEAVREALGLSSIISADITPTTAEPDTEFEISIETVDQIEGLPYQDNTDVIAVSVTIYSSSSTPVETVQLADPDDDGIYTGSCTISSYDDYYIDVDVFDSAGHLEVQRSIASFSVADVTTPTTSETGTTSSDTSSTTSETETTSGTVEDTLDQPIGLLLIAGGAIVGCVVIFGLRLRK
ncbi:MAG: DJ-1/PfpI family protein [Candidatus Thorarchaeota archaeon]